MKGMDKMTITKITPKYILNRISTDVLYIEGNMNIIKKPEKCIQSFN